MKHLRLFLWFVAALTFASVAIDLPKEYRLNFSLGPVHIDRVIHGPDLDVSLGGIHIAKKWEPHFGLDLSGGTHIVLEANMKDVPSSDRDQAFESARSVIERRVNLYGLSEPIIQPSRVGGAYRINVDIPGASDTTTALELIGKTALLDFREEGTPSADITDATQAAIMQIMSMKKTGLTGKHLSRAQVAYNSRTGFPEVELTFNAEGTKLFEDLTERNIGKGLGIFLDDQIISYPPPVVQTKISGGQAVISGQFSAEYAKQLATTLNAGALPVPITIVEQRQVGATLGQVSIHKSLIAGAVGLVIIALFMIVNYGMSGVAADVSLVIYTLVSYAVFILIPITLTLAGIAGFILSIGMAVDANILIFERIKEEMRWGKDHATAVRYGFDRAYPSIRDSNMSSLLTCGILYYFGTGLVRGFAITLAIGIALSLFSAITITKNLLRMMYK